MTTWDELKVILLRLRDLEPHPLLSFPDPRVDRDRHPPFAIRLAAWAEDLARDLHERFADDVRLTVGVLGYPRHTPTESRPVEPTEELSPEEFHVELAESVVVRSGHNAHQHLLITNLSQVRFGLSTNGHLTASVVDPASGNVVAGFAGAQTLAMVHMMLPPGKTQRIPLIIGTASHSPELGYAVPAGEWAARAVLKVGGDGRVRRLHTPLLPITVID
ncbi:MAG TPA: hypothetical protein VHX38_21700 [Pseudonocardiaceae bacterium]|jgi:hypothetical protein|nr:hypothetical protein [Pseudonocardiaceae bacterium]